MVDLDLSSGKYIVATIDVTLPTTHPVNPGQRIRRSYYAFPYANGTADATADDGALVQTALFTEIPETIPKRHTIPIQLLGTQPVSSYANSRPFMGGTIDSLVNINALIHGSKYHLLNFADAQLFLLINYGLNGLSKKGAMVSHSGDYSAMDTLLLDTKIFAGIINFDTERQKLRPFSDSTQLTLISPSSLTLDDQLDLCSSRGVRLPFEQSAIHFSRNSPDTRQRVNLSICHGQHYELTLENIDLKTGLPLHFGYFNKDNDTMIRSWNEFSGIDGTYVVSLFGAYIPKSHLRDSTRMVFPIILVKNEPILDSSVVEELPAVNK